MDLESSQARTHGSGPRRTATRRAFTPKVTPKQAMRMAEGIWDPRSSPIKIKFNLQDAYSMELGISHGKVGMSLIWIWCLFFKSLNSCFRHLKAWGLHLQEIRIVNCNWSSNEQTEVWTRWLQTVRDLRLESFSKISLEKVWKGERWVSNTEISFERLWTLLVDVVHRVFLLVSNFSVYLLAEILVILLIYCIWWCHSFKGWVCFPELRISERLSSCWNTI